MHSMLTAPCLRLHGYRVDRAACAHSMMCAGRCSGSDKHQWAGAAHLNNCHACTFKAHLQAFPSLSLGSGEACCVMQHAVLAAQLSQNAVPGADGDAVLVELRDLRVCDAEPRSDSTYPWTLGVVGAYRSKSA